jgi:hypothetical protein
VTDVFRWAATQKNPGEEIRSVQLNLFGLCANFWMPNEQYSPGDVTWPLVLDDEGYPSGIGNCFEMTSAGISRSGAVQPRFANNARSGPSVLVNAALPTLDGSCQWTCRPPDFGGINAAVLADPGSIVPDGIQVTGLVVNDSMKLFVDYAGGTLDEDYEVVFRFLIAGRLRIGRQVVQVRKL